MLTMAHIFAIVRWLSSNRGGGWVGGEANVTSERITFARKAWLSSGTARFCLSSRGTRRRLVRFGAFWDCVQGKATWSHSPMGFPLFGDRLVVLCVYVCDFRPKA